MAWESLHSCLFLRGRDVGRKVLLSTFLPHCHRQGRAAGWWPQPQCDPGCQEHTGKLKTTQHNTKQNKALGENRPLVLEFSFQWQGWKIPVMPCICLCPHKYTAILCSQKHTIQKSPFKCPWRQKGKQMCHCSLGCHRAPPSVSCNLLIPRGTRTKELPQESFSPLCKMEMALDKIQISPGTAST